MYHTILRRIITHPQYAIHLVRKLIQRRTKVCPYCGTLGHRQIHHTDQRGIRTFLCTACAKTYSELQGTIFFRSKLPLHVWLQAILYWSISTGSLSAAELGRLVHISHPTAWRLLMRIREVLASADPPDKLLLGIVEMDESWFGKKKNQEICFGIVQRETRKLFLTVIPNCTEATLMEQVEHHVLPHARVNTDGWVGYHGLSIHYTHDSVNHSKAEFARDEAHTNTIEQIWGMIKGILRTIHHGVSKKYRSLYLKQFIFRYEHEHSHNLFKLTLSKLFSPTYCLI